MYKKISLNIKQFTFNTLAKPKKLMYNVNMEEKL